MDFETAVQYVNARIVKKNMTDRDRLMVYGLFKQANKGDAPLSPPEIKKENAFRLMKWVSWKNFRGISAEQAKEYYCLHVKQMQERDGDS